MRTAAQRRVDSVRRLENDASIWIATASAIGIPHLIPLSLAWDGEHLLLATPTNSPTVRNATDTGAVKATLDSAEDVVLIDGTAEVSDFGAADAGHLGTYVQRVGWNPADQDGEWSLLVVRPRTVRAWNSVAEGTGRTIMKEGDWLE